MVLRPSGWVINLLDSWGAQIGRGTVLEAWRLAPLCVT